MTKLKEDLAATGSLAIVVFGPDGTIKEKQFYKNLVVTVGKTFIASRMASDTKAVMSHMALGSGTTATVIADTALEAQLGGRQTLTSSTASANTVPYVAVFGPGVGTGAVTEAGIFNAATGGEMLARTVFPVINKGADDTMSITWTVSIS